LGEKGEEGGALSGTYKKREEGVKKKKKYSDWAVSKRELKSKNPKKRVLPD